MESISILSLNGDCLCNIISHLDDFSSFYSFSLTCKRFKQLAENERSWHINVLKGKAEFYTRQFIVYSDEVNGYESRQQLYSLFEESLQQCSTDIRLSFNEILDVWKSCGPVAAKFFSWIKSSSSVTREEGPRETCLTNYAEQTFYLPISGQRLSIATSHFDDYNGLYDRKTSFIISCGDLVIENKVSNIIPEDFYYCMDGDEMRAVIDSMKPVIELLQKELGDTVPPITDKFFVWMCFRFPSLSEENKIYFKDEAKNAIPTPESLQTALALNRRNKSGKIKKTPVEKWLKRNGESNCAKMITRVLKILVQRSRTAIVRQLREDVVRFPDVIFECHLKKSPKKMMLDLVNRTTLFLGKYSAAAGADKCVGAHFRMKGGSVVKIDRATLRDVASYPTWYELNINFVLSNGNKIQIEIIDLLHTKGFESLTSKFSPITEILQECIDESMKDEEKIPKIQNIFTLCYFLQVLQFSEREVADVLEHHCDQQVFVKYADDNESHGSTSGSDRLE